MKAKEYVEKYRELCVENKGDEDKALVLIAREFMVEASEIAKKRNAQRNEAVRAVFREQEQKWKVFCRLLGDPSVRKDGFRVYLIHEIPFLEDEDFEPQRYRKHSLYGTKNDFQAAIGNFIINPVKDGLNAVNM